MSREGKKSYGEVVRVTFRGDSITLSGERNLAELLDDLKERFGVQGRGEAIYELLRFERFLSKLDQATPNLLIELRRVIALFFEISIKDPARFKTVLSRVEEYLELEYQRALAKRKGLLQKFKEAVWEADYYARCLINFGEPRPMPER